MSNSRYTARKLISDPEIVSHNAIKQRLGAFRFYLVSIIIIGLSVWLGYYWADVDRIRLEAEIKSLRHSQDNLAQDNNRLTRDLNILGVDLEVARLATQENHKRFQQNMDVEKDLRRELSFYQKVLAPELEQDGFIIDSFNVEPAASPGFYRYAMILMQQDKHRTTVKGNVTVTLMGSQADKPAEIELKPLLSKNSDNLDFSFRYFEVLKGEFNLPENFQPEIIIVESRLKDKKWGKNFLKRTFDWQLGE